MGKIEAVMKLYKKVFPHVTLEQRGTWIKVSSGFYAGKEVNLHSHHLLEEIFAVTGEEWEWDDELKSLYKNDPNDTWNTNNSWNTNLNDWEINRELVRTSVTVKEPEEENLFEDIGEM